MSDVPVILEIAKSSENITPPPKRRGRKRKSEIALQQKLEEIIETVPVEETISRRGRPRKKVNYYELANPDNIEIPPETQSQLKYSFSQNDESNDQKKIEKSVSKEFLLEKSEDAMTVANYEASDPLEVTQNEIASESTNGNDLSANDQSVNLDDSNSVNEKDKKYNYTGETVKMMNKLFTMFSDEKSVNESSNSSTTSKRAYRKSKKVDVKEEEMDDGSGNVTCAICNATFEKNMWSHHKQRYHNNLAWRVGDPPLDLNDQAFVMHTLNALYKKKKPLYCDKCGEVKKSVVGFLSHRSQCLKSGEQLESVKVACEICGRRMLPVSMSTHMKTIHQNPEKFNDYAFVKSPNDFNKPLPSKRSAAKKAMRIIENVTKTDHKDKYFSTNLDLGAEEFAKALLQKELDDTQFIECKFRCNCITTNMEDALKHMDECTEKPLEACLRHRGRKRRN